MSQFTLFMESTTSSTFHQHVLKLVIDVGEEWNQSWIALIPARLSPILGQVKLLALKNIDLSQAHPSIYRIFSLFRPLQELSLETIRCHQYSQIARLAHSTQADYVLISDPSYSRPLEERCLDMARTFPVGRRLSAVELQLTWSELGQLSRCWSFLHASLHVSFYVHGADTPGPRDLRKWGVFWRRLFGLFESMSNNRPSTPFSHSTQTLHFAFRAKLDFKLSEDIVNIDNSKKLTTSSGTTTGLGIGSRTRSRRFAVSFNVDYLAAVPYMLQQAASCRTPQVTLDFYTAKEPTIDPMAFYRPAEWAAIDDGLCCPPYSQVTLYSSSPIHTLPTCYKCTDDFCKELLPQLWARNIVGKCIGDCIYHIVQKDWWDDYD
ncbi:hypothetical protein EIP91_002155 [Steccherinum ochraceum]|uniref:F-box domain-containing protein n=1 Tax=Steccherinum ochraceum TaxID=92696 RepID=A0A4R0RL72_9APHY|nr:hypothetical protein EIP91_002155 [Steccherinum ochraceum]